MLQRSGEVYYPVWQIHLNNIGGTNSKNFTNWRNDCTGPVWSPDGKYIAYDRTDSVGGLVQYNDALYLYDVHGDSLIAFLSSDTVSYAPGIWTLDSKRIIYGHYSNVTGHGGTSIIDLDGKNNRPLKYPVSYLYPDDYNTLYYGTDSMGGQTICHSNLDGTTNELIVDLGPLVATPTGAVNLWDFDPIGNFLLLSFDDPSTALPNSIAKYDITQRRLDTIAVSDTGWKYYKPKFSSDFKTIAFTEVHFSDTSVYSNGISLIDLGTGTKTTLVEFPDKDQTGKYQFLDMNPFAFAKDDKYFAFVRDVDQPGQFVWWIPYLCVVDLDTKQVTYIDNAISPLWNPSMAH